MVKIQVNSQGKAYYTSSGKVLLAPEMIGIPREVSAQGVYQMPTTSFTFSLPSDATDINKNGLRAAFYGSTTIVAAEFPELTSLSGEEALNGAFSNSSLSSISFPKLTTITGGSALIGMCQNASLLSTIEFPELTTVSGARAFNSTFSDSKITSVSFPKLTTISSYNAFIGICYRCNRLTSILFPELTTVSGEQVFQQAFTSNSLSSISFPKLTTITGYSTFSSAFYNCTALESVSFPALTTNSFGSYINQFNNMLYNSGTNVTHTIHFPSNLESKISTLTGYPLFGGTSGYVTLAFDLPATS